MKWDSCMHHLNTNNTDNFKPTKSEAGFWNENFQSEKKTQLTNGKVPLVRLAGDDTDRVGRHGEPVLDAELLQPAHRVARGLRQQRMLVRGA